MTRIGLLTSSFPSRPGDPAGGFVHEHARWLRDQGFEVEVLAARPGSAGREPGLKVTRLPFGRRIFGGQGAPEILAAGRAWPHALAVSVSMLAEAVRRRRHWDRIIAHWLVPAGLAAAVAADGRPVRAIAHSGDVHLLRRLGLVSVAAAALVQAKARISFVTEHLREIFLREVGPAGLRRRVAGVAEVTPMGVDIARFQCAGEREPGGDRPVAFLGRLVPIKGADVAIAAASRWRAPASLAIAGAGPDAGLLRAQAATLAPGRVVLCGEVRGNQRDRFVAAAAALIVPSRQLDDGRTEGLPVVALEAMAAGVPVIASAVGGLEELPPDTRRCVPPNDPHALAAAVDRLLDDRPGRDRQVAAAAAFVRSRDWRAVGPRLI